MDLQTTDNLLHRLSSCCTTNGHPDFNKTSDFTIVIADTGCSKHTEYT